MRFHPPFEGFTPLHPFSSLRSKSVGVEGAFQRVESVIVALWTLADLVLAALLLMAVRKGAACVPPLAGREGLCAAVGLGAAVVLALGGFSRERAVGWNRDVVPWLVEEYGGEWKWDMLVLDELSSFKNPQAKRFKALLKVRSLVRRVVGLTGTPSSNGLMDLWAEYRLLDLGERLGRFITRYRQEFFRPEKTNGQIVYSYTPLPGAEERIYRRIADITISMRCTDHLVM